MNSPGGARSRTPVGAGQVGLVATPCWPSVESRLFEGIRNSSRNDQAGAGGGGGGDGGGAVSRSKLPADRGTTDWNPVSAVSVATVQPSSRWNAARSPAPEVLIMPTVNPAAAPSAAAHSPQLERSDSPVRNTAAGPASCSAVASRGCRSTSTSSRSTSLQARARGSPSPARAIATARNDSVGRCSRTAVTDSTSHLCRGP